MRALLEIRPDGRDRIVGLGVIESCDDYYVVTMTDSRRLYKVKRNAIRQIVRSENYTQIICSKTTISIFNVEASGSACTDLLMCSKNSKVIVPQFSDALSAPLLVLNSLWLDEMQARASCKCIALITE